MNEDFSVRMANTLNFVLKSVVGPEFMEIEVSHSSLNAL